MSDCMDKYADWLDDLQNNDPEGYARLMTQVQLQLTQKTISGEKKEVDIEDFAKAIACAKESMDRSNPDPTTFEPKLPGGKVMTKDGVSEKKEGMMIDVEPAFVLKTKDEANNKIFINFCQSEHVKNFSEQKHLDEKGKEQEGIHIPLSVGPCHNVKDHSGSSCSAYDIAVNTEVIKNCNEDVSGTFRNFLCELALNYIHQKYNIKLDSRYKLPKAQYKGNLPPLKHYIRKDTKPKITDISNDKNIKIKLKNEKKEIISSKKRIQEHIQYELMNLSHSMEESKCKYISAAEGGPALSSSYLKKAPYALRLSMILKEANTNDIQLNISEGYLCLHVPGFHALDLFLPFLIIVKDVSATFDKSSWRLLITMPINKNWKPNGPDIGSHPWLLAKALDSGKDDLINEKNIEKEKNVLERFHLFQESKVLKDPSMKNEDDDEELPEDKFHRKDVMSQHILDQRKEERDLKAKKSEEERIQRRKEQEAKLKAANDEGKTWSEMYPNEPETTYIDLKEMNKKEPEKEKVEEMKELSSESALEAAAAWSSARQQFKLNSSLAFELLE